MSSQPAAEASAVDKPAKAAKPATRKRAAPARATTPRKRPAASKAATAIVEPVAAPPAAETRAPRHNLRALAVFGSVLVAGAAIVLLIGQGDDAATRSADKAVSVSAAELAAFADTQDAPVYWAGPVRSRTLELTSTDSGAFVRYLPAGAEAGTSRRALTVATYPMRDAYATAASRAKEAGMTSRPTRNEGLAVWSTARPTSVYVAFRGVPALIEVYAPAATEARTIALSGRVQPVG